MNQHPFESVTVESDGTGHYTVTSFEDALELLRSGWPKAKTTIRLKDHIACLTVILSGVSVEEARTAFILTAKQSGKFIREGEERSE